MVRTLLLFWAVGASFMLDRLRCGRQHTRTRIGPKGHFAPKQAICIRTTRAELGLLAYLAQSPATRPIDAELPVLDDAPEDQRRTLSREHDGGTARVLLSSSSLSVTLSIDEILRPSSVWSHATDPREASSAVVKRSSS